jgi:hypothetical protein
MAHRTRIRPSIGFWSPGSAVTYAEYEALDAAQFAAVDGDAGGLWLPSAKIILGGANGLDMFAPLRAMGSFLPAAMIATNWPERAVGPGSVAAVNSDMGIAWSPSQGGLTSSLWATLDASKSVYISADGLSWASITTLANSSTTAPDIAAGQLDGAPVFMANGGSSGVYYTCPNPIALGWTARASGPGANSVAAYSSSLNRWVTLGPGGAAAWAVGTTAGLASWTGPSLPSGWTTSSGGAKRIVWNGSLFVAIPVSSYNKVLTSSDGATWTERTLPATGIWTGLAYSPTDATWMATAINLGNGAVSSDGLTWTAPTGTGYTIGNDLAAIDSLWVMPNTSGNYGGISWSIDKGASWKRVAVGNHSVATLGWKRVLAGDNRFMVAHQTGSNIEVAMSLRS